MFKNLLQVVIKIILITTNYFFLLFGIPVNKTNNKKPVYKSKLNNK